MCGICAVSRADRSSIPNINLFMRHASYAIESRGKHATGFAWRDRKARTWYAKSPGKATDVSHTIDMSGARIAIGHTRYATQGKPEENSNNHPLVEENITLVHNGVVDNDWWIFRQLTDLERHNEVDSQAIACLLAYPEEFGDDTPGSVLENNFEGDAALAWLDSESPDTLHLCRVLGRPMFIGHTRKGDLVMASTAEALTAIERMSGVSIGDITEVPEGTYMQVVKGEIVHTECFTPYERPKIFTKYGSNSVSSQTSKTPNADKQLALVEPRDDPFNRSNWELLEEIGGNWEFLEWDDQRLAQEMVIEWHLESTHFEDQKSFQACLREFRKSLEEEAELADWLAMQEIADQANDAIDAEVIDEEVEV